MQHVPVLLDEVITGLHIKPDGIYIDATFGRGGHSLAILAKLNEQGKLFAIDKDDEAIRFAEQSIQDKRFTIRKGSFVMLQQWIESLQLGQKIDGILLDLGVSSPQLDSPERGFSFLRDGPLDMRMDITNPLTAERWINTAPEREIAQVLKEYGEERFSKRIANAIVTARAQHVITRTLQLAEIIKKSNPSWEKHKHPATRSFQAIRIFINQELEDLSECLAQCLTVLKTGGRLAVISFHSLEDRIVKRFFKQEAQGKQLPKDLPVKDCDIEKTIKLIGKAQYAGEAEVAANPRARSAVLRIVEKL